MSAVIAGMKTAGTTFADQRLLVYGAGTAGTGMADQIHAGMIRAGLTPDEAKGRIWMIDSNGLVSDDMKQLPDYQAAYARPASETADWDHQDGIIGLLETVKRVHPTILIGTSTDHGAFTQEVIEALSAGYERLIVLPLSNPTEKIEAMPKDVIAWSKGPALVATGIPIEPFDYNGTTFLIGQGNNSLLYPGLGLGRIVSGVPHVTDAMILAAAEAAAGQVTSHECGASLLPPADHLRHVGRRKPLDDAKQSRLVRRVARIDVLAACQQEVRDLLGGREVHEPRLVGGPPQVRADHSPL